MYVFFDRNGDIKAITPSLDDNLSTSFSTATFPLAEVEAFLTAERNTFDYYVKKIDKISGTTYKLIKKKSDISYTRTLDSYLTKVEDAKRYDNILLITNDVANKVVSVEIDKEFKTAYVGQRGSEEQQETMDDFFSRGPSIVYLTKRNNPYHLLFSFSFTPRDLLGAEKLYFNYTGDYNEASVYTKKLITGYGYKEKVL
jgi:hypothetical protein